MKYLATINVKLKEGHTDVEGDTAAEALRELKYPVVGGIRIGKIYYIEFEANSPEDAKKKTEEMCRRHLANPVRDDYEFKVQEEK